MDTASSPPDPLLGKVIAGKYKIVERIGSGGMSGVYKADHFLINRAVAVKLLSPSTC